MDLKKRRRKNFQNLLNILISNFYFALWERCKKHADIKMNEDGEKPYEGNRFRYYSRYRFEASDRFSAGITAEKDPGEAFFKGSNKTGFDFYSGHVSLNFKGPVQNITVGDFIVRSGQGLVLWQGFTTGKSVYTLDILKTSQGVRPYTSVDENFFFRGVSTSFKWGKANLNLFYSSKNTDANQIISENGNLEFTSLQTSGYHRTDSEIEDEKSVKRTTDRRSCRIYISLSETWSHVCLRTV